MDVLDRISMIKVEDDQLQRYAVCGMRFGSKEVLGRGFVNIKIPEHYPILGALPA